MFEVSGKYNTAQIFTDVIEQEAISQVINMCNQEFAKDSKIRIMPDVHAGAGCTIGTTMTITDKVVPNLVGVDVACGMEVTNLGKCDIDFTKLDDIIHQYIPSGMNTRTSEHRYMNQVDLTELHCYHAINEPRVKLSMGTLGGGNHFIEVDTSEDGTKYLVIHSGSRNLGVSTAKYYQEEAYRRLSKKFGKDTRKEIITRLKSEGHQKDISAELKKLSYMSIPKDFAYCEGELFEQYIHDMRILQKYATLNRQAMTDEIVTRMGFDVQGQFTTLHNYIDTENMILRKGAVSAQKGEVLLIPINMRDGSLICAGKGNPDWNCSAPHGAGRLMSRSQAKQTFTMEEFEKSMEGIYTTSVNPSTLDESPMSYKSIDDIVNNIGDTVTIDEIIKPVYNFKASD